jgi:lactoylglutathione lyase
LSEKKPSEGVNPLLWQRGPDDEVPRLLHTMLRVTDFDASLRFYRDTLGMAVIDRFDVTSRRASGVFLAFGGHSSPMLELTRRWDVDGYTHGDAYGHVAIGVADLVALCERIAEAGWNIVDWPDRVVESGPLVAFVKDPDDFLVELVQMQGD